MSTPALNNIINQFLPDLGQYTIDTIHIGLINETYEIKNASNKSIFILQKINQNVFKHVDKMMSNISIVQNHFETISLTFTPIKFIQSNQESNIYIDQLNHAWRMMKYIPHQSLTHTPSPDQVAKIIAQFHLATNLIPNHLLVESIPHFHDLTYYWNTLEDVINKGSKRFDNSKELKQELLTYKWIIEKFQKLKSLLPLKITHNDPKTSNILFDITGQSISIIDWDTIMPGYRGHDFGDAVRTLCNVVDENETQLNLIDFDVKSYKSFEQSYITHMGENISVLEQEHLLFFSLKITFEQAIRFYTDYLNYDPYYQTSYANQNLVRAQNQTQLLHRMKGYYSD